MDEQTDSSFQLKPGPRDPSVLHLQSQHRSSSIWSLGGGVVQRSRIRSNKLGTAHPLMVPLLKDVGFDGVARLAGILIDWSLITALIERWRSETHTFHLPLGECTITLQDVSVLLGLRIDGLAVSGSTDFKGGWSELIEKVFGEAPGNSNLDGGRLKLSWLGKLLPPLSDDADNGTVIRYTQCFILQLIGGVLFTDHQGSEVHCMFLPLIQDLAHSRTIAWGAGVLAYLYREMCKACKKGVEEIAGCVLLLQLWAWTRLPTLAPVPRTQYVDNGDIWGDLPGPFGLRWCVRKCFSNASTHVVSINRFSLDVLGPLHFIWLPYVNEIDNLSDICREGKAIWCYTGPLICFHIVEPHEPSRCVRQFNMVQDIPPSCIYSADLHKLTLKGKSDLDWRHKHQEYIVLWNNRLQYSEISGDVGVDVTDRYAEWYANITRLYHTHAGASQSYVFNILNRISAIAGANGDYKCIDDLASHARRVLACQYSRGLREDLLGDDSYIEKSPIEVKVKKVGHKGGRGGVNCSKRRKIQTDEVNSSLILVEEAEDAANIPLEDILASIDYDVVGNQPTSNIPVGEKLPCVEDDVQNPNSDLGIDDTPPLTHPTFDLGIEDTPPLLQRQLSAPFEQQQPSVEQEQAPPVDQQQYPPVQQHQPEVDQQQPAIEIMHEEPEVHEHNMLLRPRKEKKVPTCGTDGHKDFKLYRRRRLVKKYK